MRDDLKPRRELETFVATRGLSDLVNSRLSQFVFVFGEWGIGSSGIQMEYI